MAFEKKASRGAPKRSAPKKEGTDNKRGRPGNKSDRAATSKDKDSRPARSGGAPRAGGARREGGSAGRRPAAGGAPRAGRPARGAEGQERRSPRPAAGRPEGGAPRRFDRKEGAGAPRRFERKEEGSAPRRFDRKEGAGAPRRFERKEEGSAPRRFDRKEGAGAPRRFEGRASQAAPRRFEGKEGVASRRETPRLPEMTKRLPPKVGAARGVARGDGTRGSFVAHEFHIWGRRTVEAYLTEQSSRVTDGLDKVHALHIIVDKTGKAPAQLKTIVDLGKVLGFPLRTHTAADETWPLGEDADLNHQRVCLRVPNIATHSVEDVCAEVKAAVAAGVKGAVGVVLDQVQDPRNFGAILRSAAFFGLKFAIFGQDRQAQITPYVLKSSAGGAFQVKLAEVVNISRALTALKEAGAWIVGTTLEDSVALGEVPKDRPYVIVLGNEGSGLRQEVVRHCDYKARIAGGGITVDSLNVSVAAGVVFHALAAE